MAKVKLGNLCAYIAPEKAGQKARYPRIGTAFVEHDNHDRVSIIIDTIPHSGSGWTGWCNVFPDKEADDDIPF